MKLKPLLVYFLMAIFFSAMAQNETNIWYFGQNAGLDFNSGPPVVITDGALNTGEGCSVISDEEGNLLFYTDGILVWDKTHTQMTNGYDLMGHISSSQSALIVSKPGTNTNYYIFTVDAQFGLNGLRYSEVDMTQRGGLGDVLVATKNIP